jgi:two-component system OmpR family sensor kinase
MKSLRGQFTLAVMALLAIVGLIGTGSAYYLARDESQEFLDHQLRAIAHNASDVPPRPSPPDPDPNPPDADDLIVIQIWSETGAVIRKDPHFDIPRQSEAGFADVAVNGKAWRTYTLPEAGRTVQISQLVEGREEIANRSAFGALIPMLTLVPVAFLLIGPTVGHILNPLSQLAEAVRRRPAGSAEQLSLAGLPAEVVPVVSAMNELLTRQQKLLQERQRFISDAAHQLRTPLTALRLQAENAIRVNKDAGLGVLLEELNEGFRRMTRTTKQMLDLARADGLVREADPAGVDVAAVLREVVAEAVPRAGERRIDLGLDANSEVSVSCRADNLRMIVGNLLDNAIRYSPCGSGVDVRLVAEGSSAIIVVDDQGPGIPEDELPHAFERFHRGADARGEGSGLGLAIALELAAREGATIALTNHMPGPGLRAEVRLSSSQRAS